MNGTIKKLCAVLMCVVFLLSISGCTNLTRDAAELFGTETAGVWGQSSTLPSAMPGGEPGIPGTWTVMIYLNGSDLESSGGEGTNSLQDILDAQLPESVRVLIYTGGTSYWHNELVTPAANQIWTVEDSSLTLLETLDTKSMGDSATLAEFINYGQTNYPADRKALLMWDHGAGSIIGFGADELYNYDGLLLNEMANAFAASDNGQKFELVGFDACLMASVEMASIAAPYAKYLVASEEVEPGSGWDYEYLLNALGANTAMTGKELGVAITDGYYARNAGTEMEGIITCSVIDLSKIQEIEDLLGAYAANLQIVGQPSAVMALSQVRIQSEAYGYEPETDSLDMIDFYNFIELQQGGAATADLLAAIEDAVVYEVSGSQRPNSYGMSIFFPSALAGDSFNYYLDIYSQLDFCPEYKQFVLDFATELKQDSQATDNPQFDSNLIEAAHSDNYDEVGSYYVQLSDEEMEYMCYVYCTLGMYLDDGTVVDFGYDSDLTINYEDNTIHDNFQGNWTGLNGQFVAVYVMDETDDYVIYNIPVLYNGERAVIRATWLWDGNYYVYNGMYYSNDEYAAPTSKLAIVPQIGDKITPIYWPVYTADGDYETYYEGTTFTVGPEGLVLEWITLPNGDYQYGFMFLDVYGGIHYSELIDFEVY